MMTMRRIMAGLYQGDDVRCERVGGAWAFDIKGRQLGGVMYWIEYSPEGHWCSIGRWKTRQSGLFVAEQLRLGTHFWDCGLRRTRLYNEEVYERIRQSTGIGISNKGVDNRG